MNLQLKYFDSKITMHREGNLKREWREEEKKGGSLC